MKLIQNHSLDKKLVDNILSIAVDAHNAKVNDPSTIDATIGTMNDEFGNMLEFSTIKKILDNLTYYEKYSYSSTDGGSAFKEGIAKWVFRDFYEEAKKTIKYEVVATPGGSGAISDAMSNYLNQGDSILIPNICWTPYTVMAKEHYLTVDYYDLFKDNKFNLDSFKEAILNQVKKQKRVFTIINDPCHNPTGYALSDNEWEEIIKFLNSIKDVPVTLLYDMAYIDYSHKGIDGSRDIFKKFLDFNDNIIVILSFSGSKTLSLYGMRIGAVMCITKQEETASDFFFTSEYSARGYWSNTPKIGISLISKLMNDNDNYNSFSKEIKDASELLLKRSQLFLKEVKEVGLEIYPYVSGFFVTIPCNGKEVFNRLKEKNIYVVPLKHGIRISLSALNMNDIKGLAKKIKEQID